MERKVYIVNHSTKQEYQSTFNQYCYSKVFTSQKLADQWIQRRLVENKAKDTKVTTENLWWNAIAVYDYNYTSTEGCPCNGRYVVDKVSLNPYY